ncbi:MAG: nuclear transport factor 2 family protein [Acidobacteria bacterium]|nr:nuclear transport factor 2 family protein [Acidobacteriota bacterium]
MPQGPDISRERDLLTSVYAAFNRRDIDRILPAMDPAVEWPNGMEGGWVHGREGVRSYWTRQWNMIDPRVIPTRFDVDEMGCIVVDVHQTIRNLAGEIVMDRMVQHVYTIREGMILRMEIRE